MNWWKRGTKEGAGERIIKTPPVDMSGVADVPTAPLKTLNNLDRDAIRVLEVGLIKSGVLGIKGEEIDTPERIDDVLESVASQGSHNVENLLGDPTFDRDFQGDVGGVNFLLEDDVDESELMTYDLYNETKSSKVAISVETESDDGSVALRLPDGTTIFGRIPGED